MSSWQRWIPGGILFTGCLANLFLVGRKVTPEPLREPVETVAPVLAGATGIAKRFSTETEQTAGMSSYIYREYTAPNTPDFTVYVGYYEEQRQGKSIHSPKNCLPGSGWEAVDNTPVAFQSGLGSVTVNRYRVAKPGKSALVYYWYQGRGRVEHDEFRVKYELLRDAAMRGRTEEALVRIIVYSGDPDEADRLAQRVVGTMVDDVQRALPVF